MIPILYEKDETAFVSNGLGRLRDCISCVVTEERNGIYECDFEYPVDGQNFDKIIPGRIIAVTHDETGDVQPFDIMSYSRPINGVVTFHAVHVSYRLTKMVCWGSNINSLSAALTMCQGAYPSGTPFTYSTDKTVSAYMAAADGTPRSVRQMLGGIEGSILDTYGGEYEFNRFDVKLWASRGTDRGLTIRYGVNLVDYQEDTDYTDTYSAFVPYWSGTDDDGKPLVIRGFTAISGAPSYNGRIECVPMDLTDKFENKPTFAQVNAMAAALIANPNIVLPQQSITVDFVRLADSPEYEQFKKLQECRLCDTVRVVFPRYGISARLKIVKTEYDVLGDKFNTLELGSLSTSLSEALGISNGLDNKNGGITPQASGDWTYIEINGMFIGSYKASKSLKMTTATGSVYTSSGTETVALPKTLTNNLFTSCEVVSGSYPVWSAIRAAGNSDVQYQPMSSSSRAAATYSVRLLVVGTVSS